MLIFFNLYKSLYHLNGLFVYFSLCKSGQVKHLQLLNHSQEKPHFYRHNLFWSASHYMQHIHSWLDQDAMYRICMYGVTWIDYSWLNIKCKDLLSIKKFIWIFMKVKSHFWWDLTRAYGRNCNVQTLQVLFFCFLFISFSVSSFRTSFKENPTFDSQADDVPDFIKMYM